MILQKTDYVDLPFFITKNYFTHDLNLVKKLSCIKKSVKNIVLTNYGERPFNYKFGGNLYDKLFEHYSYELVLGVQESIGGNLQLYESRIQILDIRVYPNPKEYKIDIVLTYNIPFLGIDDQLTVSIMRTR